MCDQIVEQMGQVQVLVTPSRGRPLVCPAVAYTVPYLGIVQYRTMLVEREAGRRDLQLPKISGSCCTLGSLFVTK
jgi:hypothetical protein